MPTCGTCNEKKAKTAFEAAQLKLGPDRQCITCVQATSSLFSKALSTRRFDEVSTDAQVERLRSLDANSQMDAANKLWTLTRRGSEAVDRDIAAAGAIKPLVELLRCTHDDRAWTAAMTLQALSVRSDARKGLIAECADAVPLLVAMLAGPSLDDMEVASMVLHNLAFSSAREASEKEKQEVIERQRLIVNAKAAPRLVEVLRTPEEGAREAAAATLACLLADSDELRDIVVGEVSETNAIEALGAMIKGLSLPEGRYDAGRVLKALARRSEDATRIVAELDLDLGDASSDDTKLAALNEHLDRMVFGELSESVRTENDDIHSNYASQRDLQLNSVSPAVAVS